MKTEQYARGTTFFFFLSRELGSSTCTLGFFLSVFHFSWERAIYSVDHLTYSQAWSLWLSHYSVLLGPSGDNRQPTLNTAESLEFPKSTVLSNKAISRLAF